MNKNTFDDIFEDFKLYFPGISEDVVNWYPSGRHEITMRLRDRTKIIYNHLSKTMRQLPKFENVVKIPEDEWRKRFSARLYNVIQDKCINQSDLSNLTGISQVSISKYVSGKASPSSYTLAILARALECSVSELTDFE